MECRVERIGKGSINIKKDLNGRNGSVDKCQAYR